MKTAQRLQKSKRKSPMRLTAKKALALLLSILMLISICPISIFASEESTHTPSSGNGNGQAPNAVTVNGEYASSTVRELLTRREENVKHFLLPDGTVEAVVYGNSVHRKDSNGDWQDIDNRLNDGYEKNKQGYITSDGRTVFSKKLNVDNPMIFEINENGYGIKVSFNNENFKNSNAKLSNHAEKYVPNAEDSFEEQYKKLKMIDNTTTLLYKNLLKDIDFEYKLFANDVKESIIINKTSEEYVYSFVYELSGLCASLGDDGSIILTDATTGESQYEISAPFLYDAEGEYSDSVYYTLDQIDIGVYEITLIADKEWINSEERELPVVIDPTVKSYTSVWDTYVDSNDRNKNFGSRTLVKVGSSCTAFFKSALPTLPSGAVIQNATWYAAYYHGSDLTFKTVLQAHMMEESWSEYADTYTYLYSDYGADLGMSNVSICNKTLTANPSYHANNPRWLELDVTSAVQAWYSGTPNNGIAILHKSTIVFEEPGKDYSTFFVSREANSAYTSYYQIRYAEPRIEDGIYRIESYDHLYLTVAGEGLQIGSRLILAEDSAAAGGVPSYNQLFKITYAGTHAEDGSNYYIIRPMTNNCLSVYASCNTASSPTLNAMNSSAELPDEQSWIISADGIYFTIRNRNTQDSQDSDYMLTVPIGATSGDSLTTTEYSFGNTIPNRYRWDLAKYDITVDNSGLINAPAVLKYDETYDFDGFMRSSRPEVNGPVQYIVVNEDYSNTDKATIDHNTGIFTPLKPGSVLIGTSYNGAQTCYYTRVTIESTPFDDLIGDNLLEYSDISRTIDGFYMLTKPLSSILNEAGIYELYGKLPTQEDPDDDTRNVLAFYDDWYLYAVESESTEEYAYGLLKMREQEDDCRDIDGDGEEDADGDDPGVTVSFVGLNYEQLLTTISLPTIANSYNLVTNLNLVTGPDPENGNTPDYDVVIAEYFAKTSSDAPYLIAEEYINFIVENCCLNNQIMAPQAFNNRMIKCANNPSSQYKRLEEAMNQNNENASEEIIKNNNGIYHIEIINSSCLTIYEKYAILMTHTGNVTFNSFAAEVEYHADMLLEFWDDLDISGYIYRCAIRSDMAIGEEKESGVTDHFYYDLNSSMVTAQKLEHGEY